MSSSTSDSPCQGRSSWRTISPPVLAVLRQWILRRSSPCRNSRTEASSEPPEPTEWLSVAAPSRQAIGKVSGASASILGCTISWAVSVERVSAVTRPNGSLATTVVGPTV